MTIRHVESTPLANLDAVASPFIVLKNTAGEGGPAGVKTVDAYLTPTASADADSTFQLVRLPSNAILKEVLITAGSQGSAGGLFDIGFCYATDNLSASSKLNHSPLVVADFPANGRTAIAAAALDPESQSSWFHGLPGVTLTVNGTTPALAVPNKWTADTYNQPIWKMIGLTSDPGGNFDLVVCPTEGLGTSAGLIYAQVKYTA